MTILPPFPGFDGLMTLSRREGVDIRPTLLRVLTDLYVQTPAHTADEERQYVELASRLIDEVDDATRAAVRARLSIYLKTPPAIAKKLALQPFNLSSTDTQIEGLQESERRTPDNSHSAATSLIQSDAVELSDMFFAADAKERRLILRKLDKAPLSATASVDASLAEHAIGVLEHAALEADIIGFTAELAHALALPNRLAQLIAEDEGGELLACAAKALDMPTDAFERVLLFLDPELGASITRVYTRCSMMMSGHAVVRIRCKAGQTRVPAVRRRAEPRKAKAFLSEAFPDVIQGVRLRLNRKRTRVPSVLFVGTKRLLFCGQLQKMPSCLVFHLDDPHIGIETNFPGKPLFDRLLRYRLRCRRRKNTLYGMAIVIGRLWRRSEQDRVAVQQRKLDENSTGFFCAAPAHCSEDTIDLTAAQIGRNPYVRFQSHGETIRQPQRGRKSLLGIRFNSGRESLDDLSQLSARSPH
jgi:hypothetical protein